MEVPGAAELVARPRGTGTPQIPIDRGVMGEDSEVRHEIVEGDDERGATGGDITQDGGAEASALQR